MLRIFGLLALTFFIATAAPAAAQEADPLSAIAGRWQIATPSTGVVSTPCSAPQVFTVSADRRYVDLEEALENGETHRARYIVLQAQPDRLLMFIEGEERLTESGDPVLWWAVFSSHDQFAWRRYDWTPMSQTAAQWTRCP